LIRKTTRPQHCNYVSTLTAVGQTVPAHAQRSAEEKLGRRVSPFTVMENDTDRSGSLPMTSYLWFIAIHRLSANWLTVMLRILLIYFI